MVGCAVWRGGSGGGQRHGGPGRGGLISRRNRQPAAAGAVSMRSSLPSLSQLVLTSLPKEHMSFGLALLHCHAGRRCDVAGVLRCGSWGHKSFIVQQRAAGSVAVATKLMAGGVARHPRRHGCRSCTWISDYATRPRTLCWPPLPSSRASTTQRRRLRWVHTLAVCQAYSPGPVWPSYACGLPNSICS